ncbi:putative inorganic phosphate cotransporter isoform X2 [Teleopsis dalmanni]|uniref:putative inorganic phosphate cotransporter isoform X2 n=1 Tax=Teleopsis dalmanni TaxID=139649 RepID=UPI0018CF0441|nr:putative inorganic phosphate cotransporter isoform X2 [Teleopsis dalmanni]XP_037955289.1 putative inorganic phosphate cotransporter isoform X2 [Teleopsis dalmanni]
MKSIRPCLGQRHVQVLLLFLSIVVNYVAKLNVGVAVVAMTNAESTNPDFKEYDWNEKQKSYILSSFFWGYFITQFPGGYLCRRFGAKTTMFYSTLGSAVLAFVPPLCVSWGGWQVYCVIRAVQGLFQGPIFPCLHAHLAAWCPVNERNRLGALANTGIECGTVSAMFLSGIIAASDLGWPGIFYISGGIGVVFCVAWILFAANSPTESKLISQEELVYIETSKNAIKAANDSESEVKIPVPWKAIMSSLPFWALVVARSAQSWGFSTLQAEIPSYMNGVLHMNMKSNALFSALPYLAMWCMSYIYLITSDILLNKKVLSLTAIRKTFNSLAFLVPAAALIGIGFLDEDQKTLAIVLMTANVGINAGSTIGSALNTIDLSPNHAGVLMGVVNTAANVVPILTPLLVGFIVQNEHDRTQWQIVFIISAVVFTVGDLFYVIFGRMKLQPWDDPDFLKAKETHNEENTKNSTENTKL